MKIAIHHKPGTFSDRWIDYCESNSINWKKVNCYSNDIISQVSDCDAFMWHFHQNNIKDVLFAKQLIYSLQTIGKKTFPGFNSVWHFDDKLGQKYLLEAIKAPMPKTYIFFDKIEAMTWAEQTTYPKVFKLRGGAGSQNVKIIYSKEYCRHLIRKAFRQGFSNYDATGSLKERYRRYRMGKSSLQDVMEGVGRLIVPPAYSKIMGREINYILFQDFIEGNDHDIRVVVIEDKAFAIKRLVRDNDFRASGSGKILYDKGLFDIGTIYTAFKLSKALRSQCVAFDFIYKNGNPLVVEISYGFSPEGYDPCPGFWDSDGNWHEGKFNAYGWMVENLIKGSSPDSSDTN